MNELESKATYQYGELTELFLKALPDTPMTLGESLCGSSKSAIRCRRISQAYGSISQFAMAEAMKIKYST